MDADLEAPDEIYSIGFNELRYLTLESTEGSAARALRLAEIDATPMSRASAAASLLSRGLAETDGEQLWPLGEAATLQHLFRSIKWWASIVLKDDDGFLDAAIIISGDTVRATFQPRALGLWFFGFGIADDAWEDSMKAACDFAIRDGAREISFSVQRSGDDGSTASTIARSDDGSTWGLVGQDGSITVEGSPGDLLARLPQPSLR